MIKITCTERAKKDMIESMSGIHSKCPFLNSDGIGEPCDSISCKECVNKTIEWEIIDD